MQDFILGGTVLDILRNISVTRSVPLATFAGLILLLRSDNFIVLRLVPSVSSLFTVVLRISR